VEAYKISMIVPVYNVEKYLTRCVESLTGQNWTNLEIILVNDGSKDQSGVLCDQLALQDSRIRVIHKENGGLISAWKCGAEHASGDYISFVDSDDWVELNMLSEMGSRLTGSSREIIASDYIVERENGQQQFIYQSLAPGEYTGDKLAREVKPELLGREHRLVTISRCMKLISADLIRKNMHYSDPAIRMSEDTTIMLPCLLDCERLVIMDHKAYYHYLYLDSSMVHKYDSGMYPNMQLLNRITEQVVRDRYTGDELSHMLKRVQMEHIHMLFLVLKNEARGNPKGYFKNIRKICKESAVRTIIKQAPVEVAELSNKLLYLVLKHPCAATILMLRMAMIVFYAGK